MMLKGTRIGILVEDLYQELEVWYPYFRLKEEGAEVLLVGTNKKEFKSKYGYPVLADVTIDRVSAGQFDALVIPGGYAPDVLRRFPAVVNLVKDVHRQGKILAAICHAGWVLASADILRGKTVTGFFAIKDDLIHAGAKYVDRDVVRDGTLITSRKPEDLPAFLRSLIEALRELPQAAKPPRAAPATAAAQAKR